MVVGTALPLYTEVQVEPPSGLLRSIPAELPATSTLLFAGSTARAAKANTKSAKSVAAKRGRGSDTSLPIITQAGMSTTRPFTFGFAYNPWVLARVAGALDRAAFKPASLPNDLITAIALAPPVIAGLIIFKVTALEMLAVALAIGAIGQIAAYLLWRKHIPRTQASPVIAAVFGIALVGVGASIVTWIEIALLAVILEVLRAHYK